MLSCGWMFIRYPSPGWFSGTFKVWDRTFYSLWVCLTWSVDSNDVEAARGAHTYTPCIHKSGFCVKSDSKQARHTIQRWAGWCTPSPTQTWERRVLRNSVSNISLNRIFNVKNREEMYYWFWSYKVNSHFSLFLSFSCHFLSLEGFIYKKLSTHFPFILF